MVTACILLILLAAAVLIASFVCFRIAFFVKPEDKIPAEEYPIPEGRIYEPFREQMVAWIKEVRSLPHEDMTITSFDGLKLRGKYYEFAPGTPVEIMFHGYRGNAERDMCGGVQRCFALGRSALIVDQRGCGNSEGNVISFGINEVRDCLAWLDHAIRRFGPGVKIILTGISMGASTVMMAAGENLPENVIGILADCGFTSAEDIMKVVIRDKMHLPPNLSYPFVKLGAKLFGHFDLDSRSAIDAMADAKVPVIFYHGEADDFVPCYMSRRNFEACTSRKRLVTIPRAGHGLCYLVDPERYLKELDNFFRQ